MPLSESKCEQGGREDTSNQLLVVAWDDPCGLPLSFLHSSKSLTAGHILSPCLSGLRLFLLWIFWHQLYKFKVGSFQQQHLHTFLFQKDDCVVVPFCQGTVQQIQDALKRIVGWGSKKQNKTEKQLFAGLAWLNGAATGKRKHDEWKDHNSSLQSLFLRYNVAPACQ